ncbi:MAG: amidohydrolase family protein [Dehalococcoidia bacterium]|nr:amidohydrolase family protein [Dehalococcoidia bacterium]
MAVKALDWMNYLNTEKGIARFKGASELAHLLKWWGMEDRYQPRSPEELVAEMDEAGVGETVICCVKMASYRENKVIYETPYEEVVDLMNKCPGRFIGFAGINFFASICDEIREMEIAVKKYGFKGIYLHTYGYRIPLNHRLCYAVYAKAEELGIPVSMQTGHSAEHMPNEMGRPMLLDDIALDFPKLNIVGSHTGWPWCEELISVAWKHENVFMDISAHQPQYLEPNVIQFLKTRGRAKTIFGTNGPVNPAKQAIEYIKTQMGLKENVQDMILRTNAARLLKMV